MTKFSILAPSIHRAGTPTADRSVGRADSQGVDSDLAQPEAIDIRSMDAMTSRATTDYLLAWSAGDETALAPLMDKVHRRLVGLASILLQGERNNHTLDAAALVNEAFLRLIQQRRVGWQDRAHFFAIAAKMMRRILVDHARRRQSEKRGQEVLTLHIDDLDSNDNPADPELTAVDQAIWELESRDPQLAEIVVLKYFGGMSRDEIAEVLHISSATVSRRWRTARAWLFEYLQ